MQQTVVVEALLGDKFALVSLRRCSACSSDCRTCGGCSTMQQTVTVTAYNPIHAVPGEKVIIQSSSKDILSMTFVVYMLPLVLMLAGYFLGTVVDFMPVLVCGIGFLVGIVVILWYNKKIEKRGKISFSIVSRA